MYVKIQESIVLTVKKKWLECASVNRPNLLNPRAYFPANEMNCM